MNTSDRERLFELLADRACGQLTPQEERECSALVADAPDVDAASFDRAAAAIHLALLEPPMEELPTRVRERILDQADSYFHTSPGAAQATRKWGRVLASPWPGWLAAAAAVLFFVLRTSDSANPTLDDLRLRAGTIALAWQQTEDPSAEGVGGQVLWNQELQRGFMAFEGLPANDPSEGQYQLWIFDQERPSETPVDGGVFDAKGDEVVVPIDAKLAVAKPGLFAITFEPPGGVVVSTRERLLLTAAVR